MELELDPLVQNHLSPIYELKYNVEHNRVFLRTSLYILDNQLNIKSSSVPRIQKKEIATHILELQNEILYEIVN